MKREGVEEDDNKVRESVGLGDDLEDEMIEGVRSDEGDNNSDGQVGEGGDITSSLSTLRRLKSSKWWADKKDMDDLMELIEGALIGGNVSVIEIKPGHDWGPAGTALNSKMTPMALTA